MGSNMWLIDANALWDEFDKRYREIDKGRSFVNEHMPIWDVIRLDEIEHGIQLVQNAAPIDAVEVVRCKDCKYARDGRSENYVLCTAHPTFLHYSPKDGFCYRGKKEESYGAD